MKAVLPAVAGCVTATTSKMQLCQEEELVWHHAIRTRDGFGFLTPRNSDTLVFVSKVWMVVTRGLMVMVWQEGKQAVGICVTVFKLDGRTVGFEALSIFVSCN